MTPYTLLFHPAIKKDLRRLDHQAAEYIRSTVLPIIGVEPHKGIPLRGKLRGLRKYVVHHQGVSYRVVYDADITTHRVIILHIGPRGDFYERLERRLR